MPFLYRGVTISTIDPDALKMRVDQEIRQHKKLYIFQGAVFIVLGVLAAILPGLVAISAELIIGVLLLVSGILRLLLSHRSDMHLWSFFSSVVLILFGGLMLWHPVAGLLAIIAVLMVFLFAEGIFEILLALQFHPIRHWGWMLFSGIVALILATLLWIGFPALGVLYIGLIIAINLILYGISLLMLVSNAR